MASYLDFEGVYDPKRAFAVTNWSEEDFTIAWEHEIYTLRAGEVKVFPQYLAYYITKNLVDREMYRDAAKLPSDSRDRERAEMAVANKDSRKVYEDKTIKEVLPGEESPEVTALRAKIEAELIAKGAVSAHAKAQPQGEGIGNALPKVDKPAEEAPAFADLNDQDLAPKAPEPVAPVAPAPSAPVQSGAAEKLA